MKHKFKSQKETTQTITHKSKQKWMSRLQFVNGEYPFGPLSIKRMDGKLHCENGPAYVSPTRVMYWSNGRKHGIDVDVYGSIVYYYKGVRVPSKYILDPKSVTFDEIINNKNAEVRRIGLEVYGFERMIEEGKMTLVHEGQRATLYNATVKNIDENVRVIVVQDSTDVPGVGRRKFILQVPPDIKDADEAVAWTFSKTKKTYNPVMET